MGSIRDSGHLNVPVGGIVLCGGGSRRMGEPKAWLPFGEERMLQRVVRILEAVCNPLVVVAAPGQALPELPSSVAVSRDPVADRGPLQGLAAGLKSLAGCADAAFVSSCDVPLLSPAFVQDLCGRLGDREAVVPCEGSRIHPLSAIYRLSVLSTAEDMLSQDCLRLSLLPDRCRTRFVDAEALRTADPELRSLRNVNTPEDYRAALELLEREGDGP
jgi:molybdopterin-guanine dinucleotide biosynthesis protein A